MSSFSRAATTTHAVSITGWGSGGLNERQAERQRDKAKGDECFMLFYICWQFSGRGGVAVHYRHGKCPKSMQGERGRVQHCMAARRFAVTFVNQIRGGKTKKNGS